MRALSIIIAMLLAIGVIGGVIWMIIPPMIDQFDKLGDVLTKWLHQTTHTNNLTALIKDWIQENQGQIEKFMKSKDFSDAIKSAMPKVFSVVGQTANIILSIIASMITLLYMFFILLDYETLTANWIRIFPKKSRPFWQELMKYRIYDYWFSNGYRFGHPDWNHGLSTIPPYLCTHPYCFPCHA